MGWSRPDEDYRADRYRDEHKHYSRPYDHIDPIDATAIAALARASTTTLKEAADLIQSYADAQASGTACKVLEQQHKRNMAIFEAPLSRKDPV